MDKKVIFAVAGAGKTTHLVNSLDLKRRFLLVTYTDNNHAILRRKIIEHFGYFPSNVTLYSYFTFLHAFCYKPLFLMQMRTKGINYENPPAWTQKLPRTDNRFYVDNRRRVYYNRIAKLLETNGAIGDVRRRLEKYFDAIYIDEIQDIGGHDFNLLIAICRCNIELRFVGDFYQHTFDTSRDGQTNRRLHDDYTKYKKRLEEAGLEVDATSLARSHRCTEAVCSFIRKHLSIEIYSQSRNSAEVVFLSKQEEADRIYTCRRTVKLFYQENRRYSCYSDNWGNSKGIDDYHDICVVLNGTTYKAYKSDLLNALKPQTRNKLYVACSRARGNLYLLPEQMLKKYKSAREGH
ncbi:MAG: DNA helicase UvrD [Phycisphaerales bacterium]|nr:DNA helicase UvrD [Phycisphaerales bacterium]